MKWILIANRTGALLYKETYSGNLQFLRLFTNPLGRMRNRFLQADRPGLNRGKFKGATPHRMTGERDPHDEAADTFAREIVQFVKAEDFRHNDLDLKVVAEAKFLGKIKSHFSRNKLKDKITWIEKDLKNIPQTRWPKLIGLRRNPTPLSIQW